MIGLFWLALQSGVLPALPAPCQLQEQRMGGDEVLVGGCGQSEIMLRSKPGYATAQNAATGALVILVPDSDGPRLFLLRPGPLGHAILEELTDVLLKQAGEHAGSGLYGWTVDLSQFAADGLISALRGKPTPLHATYSVVDRMQADKNLLSMRSTPVPVVAVVPEGHGPETIVRQSNQNKPADAAVTTTQSQPQGSSGK